jgi:hypothetical protein
LPLPEFVDNFFTSAGEKWEDFLDWSDEKGLPLRKASDFLESHGIPPLPFFVIVIIALIVGAFLLVLTFTAPQLGVFTVNVAGPSGTPLPGALAVISYYSFNGTLISLTSTTGSNGIASFSDVPLNANVTVSASASAYSPSQNQLTTFSQNGTGVSISLVPVTSSVVNLPVLVEGPAQATVSLLINGTLQQSVNVTQSYTFQLQPGVNYSITASAPGWRGYQSYVEIAQDSSNFIIRMFQFGQATTGFVSAVVLQDVPPNSPITNANVNIIEASTNKILGTLSTNGSTDGTTNSIQVVAGDSVYLSASAPGYLTRTSTTYNISENGINPTIYLDALSTQNSQNVGVNVVDISGMNIQSPLVSVYCDGVLFAQDTPANGVTSFNVPIGRTCLVTAFSQGYLPSSKLITSAGVGTIILLTANSKNSGGLSVETTQSGNPVGGVSVSLFNSINQPLGIPSQSTGPDGFTTFLNIPLVNATVQASGQGLTGSASVLIVNSSNLTGIVIPLTSAPGMVNFTASDFVTGNSLTVFNVSSSGVSCFTAIGYCSLSLPSGEDDVVVTSPGYQNLSFSITVAAGVPSNQSFVLIPTSFSNSLQLEFLGFYNNNGIKVNNLSPDTNYEARFILNAPTLNFSTAGVYVQLGGYEDISTDPAFISSFSGNPSAGSSLNSNTSNAELKWLSYNVSAFTGSQEFDVFIQTRSVSNASLNLQWSDSFTFGNSTFSNPPSGLNSQSIPISFEGDCVKGMCVQLYFSGVLGSGLSNFQALIPETFKLNYNILSNSSTPLLIQTNSTGLQLVKAVEGGQSFQAQDNVLSFNSNGSGYVLIKALNPINNGLISFNVGGGFSKDLYVRVIASNYNVQVTYSPTKIKALDETHLNFTVRDSTGAVISDADVELSGVLDNPVQAVYSNGVYTADITPNSPGILYFTVSSPGYRVYSGSINVGVDQIISVTPSTLSLQVNSLNFSTIDFQTQNLLNQNTLLTFQTTAFSPQYTVVSTVASSATVKGLSSFTNSLQAAVSSAIQMASLQTKTLSENVKGYVNVIARTGGYTQTIQVPFTVQTSYVQTNMQQAISLSASALQFQVILPMQPSSTQNEIITNNAPFPVLVNSQTSSGEFQVSPLSATIPAYGSQTFTVTAYLPFIYQQLQCVVSQAPDTGVANFYASAQGVSSQATPVTLSSSIQSYGTCQIPGGLVVKIPFASVFMLTPGSVSGQQSQQDGSIPVLTPQGLVIFGFGSGVQQNFISVPAGVGVEVPSNWISQSATETDMTFPFQVMISTSGANTTVNGDGSVSIATTSGTLILPSGSQLQSNQNFNYNPFNGNSYSPFVTQSGITSSQLTNPYANSYNPGLVNPYGFGPTVQPFNYIQNAYLVPAGGTIKYTTSTSLTTDLTFDYSAYGSVIVGGITENQGSVVPTNGGFDITFNKCSQIKVSAKVNPNLRLSDTLPAAREVILNNAQQASGGFEVQGQITIKACNNVDENLKYFTTVLPTPLTFNLPSITRTDAGKYDLGGCDNLNITDGSIPIMKASKINFQSNYQEVKDENANWIVNVDRLGVVSVLPCGLNGVIQVSPPTNLIYGTFNGNSISPINRINFTLTSSQRSQTQTIVLTNLATTILHPAGQVDSNHQTTFIQSIDQNVSNFFTIDNLQFSNSEPFRDLGDFNSQNTYHLTASDTFDSGCLPDKTYTGAITLAFQGNTQISYTLYVTVNTKTAGCKTNADLASALTNFSIFPNNIYFKNPGSQYYTLVSFTNNLRQPVKIEMNTTGFINCNFNSYNINNLAESVDHLDAGYGITANCSGLKTISSQPVSFNAVDPSTGKILSTASVIVNVFSVPKSEENFYTSTPIGSLAPLGIPASFINCENQFCNYNQTSQALIDFFNATTAFINSSIPTPQSLSAFCSQNLYLQNGHPLTTSAVFLMANTQSKLNDILPSLGNDVQQYGFNPSLYKSSPENDLTGCGLFEVTTKYFLCPPQSGAEWKQNAHVEVDVQKLASCPQTIADAPLFLMADNTTDAWIGRTTSNVVRDVSIHASFPPVFLGPFDNYPTNSNLQGGNSLDEGTAKSLLDSFYYSSSSKPSLSFNVAQRYNNVGFCTENAAGLGTAIGLATVTGAAIATGGLSVLLTPLALAVGSCGTSAVLSTFTGITGCEAANTCIRTEISSAILPFIKYCGLSGTATTASLVATAGISAGTGLVPAIIGAATIGSNNYQTLSGTSTGASIAVASSLATYSKTNAINMIKQLINVNKDNPISIDDTSSNLMKVLNTKYPDSNEEQMAQKIYSDAISNNPITDNSYVDTYFATAAGNIERAKFLSGDSESVLKSNLQENLVEGAGRVKTFINKIPGGLKNVGICVAIQAGVQAVIGVDMSPVQANLNPNVNNHLIVYNLKYYPWYKAGKNLPSIYSVNLSGNSFYLGNFCNSSNSLCLREWSVSENQYILIVGVNNPGLNLNDIFQSVFLPSVSPVGGLAKVVSSVVTTENIGALNDSSDEGDQTGFGSSAVQSNAGVISG